MRKYQLHAFVAVIVMLAMGVSSVYARSYGGSSSSRSSSSSSSSSRSYTPSPSRSYTPSPSRSYTPSPSRSYTPSSPSVARYGGSAESRTASSTPSAGRYGGSAAPKAASAAPSAGRYAGSSDSKAAPSAGRYAGSSDSRSATRATAATPQGSTSKTAALMQNNARENKAKSMYAAQQAKFQKKPEPIRYSSSDRSFVSSARSYDSRTHYTRVNVYYTSHHFVSPAYVHYSYPYFGIWDATWLWFAWREAQHNREMAMFFHNHQNDESIRQFRMEADRLGRENAELRAQNNAMNAQLTTMQGQPVNPNYAPAGVDKDIMLAQQALPDYNTQGVCTACHH